MRDFDGGGLTEVFPAHRRVFGETSAIGTYRGRLLLRGNVLVTL